jgi:hypothetical protein
MLTSVAATSLPSYSPVTSISVPERTSAHSPPVNVVAAVVVTLTPRTLIVSAGHDPVTCPTTPSPETLRPGTRWITIFSAVAVPPGLSAPSMVTLVPGRSVSHVPFTYSVVAVVDTRVPVMMSVNVGQLPVIAPIVPSPRAFLLPSVPGVPGSLPPSVPPLSPAGATLVAVAVRPVSV